MVLLEAADFEHCIVDNEVGLFSLIRINSWSRRYNPFDFNPVPERFGDQSKKFKTGYFALTEACCIHEVYIRNELCPIGHKRASAPAIDNRR